MRSAALSIDRVAHVGVAHVCREPAAHSVERRVASSRNASKMANRLSLNRTAGFDAVYSRVPAPVSTLKSGVVLPLPRCGLQSVPNAAASAAYALAIRRSLPLRKKSSVARESLAERDALDERYHVEQQSVGFSRIEERQDVRMLQVRRRLDLGSARVARSTDALGVSPYRGNASDSPPSMVMMSPVV